MADSARHRTIRRRFLAFVGISVVLLTSCTTTPSDAPSSAGLTSAQLSSVVSSAATSNTVSSVPPADLQSVTELVEAINATAGGQIQAQRDLLEQRTHPAYLLEQQQCAPATITIGLDPVLENLSATPGWTPTAAPSAGTTSGQPAPAAVIPTGTLYRLPVLVLVYTDTRRTGTDLTSLRISILDGRALIFPLCLN